MTSARTTARVTKRSRINPLARVKVVPYGKKTVGRCGDARKRARSFINYEVGDLDAAEAEAVRLRRRRALASRKTALATLEHCAQRGVVVGTAARLAWRCACIRVVPEGFDTEVYIVLEEIGQLGRVTRVTDEERADRETVIRQLIEGQ